MRSLTGVLTIGGLSLLLTAAAMAHHAEPLYDMRHPTTVTGVVSRVEWANPHVYLYLDVANAKGETERWSIELPSPHSLQHAGWTSTSVKPGDRIVCTGGRAKSGGRVIRGLTIEIAGGKTLKAGK